MKLSSDESRALAFVLGLVALAGVARLVGRPAPGELPTGAAIDPATLERQSDSTLQHQRALARPLAADEQIDVNAADADELDRLPGVGPALAERIVAERERGGAFDSAPDLRAVRGFGPALRSRLAPHLAFGPGEGLPRRSPPQTDGVGSPEAGRGSADGGKAGGRNRAAAMERPPHAGGRGDVVARTGSLTRDPADAGVAPSRPPALPPSPLSLSRATASELESLPGIGPALAARIVAKRDSLNGFRTIDDLVRVRGIGPATLARLKPYLRP